MLVAESSVITSAKQEDVWKIWSDVENWSKWDSDVKSCSLSGDFQDRAKFSLKPAGGPMVNVEVVECVAMKRLVSKGALPFYTYLIFDHEMTQIDGQLKVTHRVQLKGCLSLLFYCLLRPSIQRSLPLALRNLTQLAEKMRE